MNKENELWPGCLQNDTGYHRPNSDGACSDCGTRRTSKTKVIQSYLRDASMCLKLAACGDGLQFAAANYKIEEAQRLLSEMTADETSGDLERLRRNVRLALIQAKAGKTAAVHQAHGKNLEGDFDAIIRSLTEGSPEEPSACNCPEVCKVCGGREKTCTLLGHRPEADRSVKWHTCSAVNGNVPTTDR